MKYKYQIYIAGKVTGLPYEQVKRNFEAAEQELGQSVQNLAVNPLKEIEGHNQIRKQDGLEPWTDETHRKEIMGYCLHLLSTCDTLYLLPDWNTSSGAQMERDFALKMGMNIVYAHQYKHQKARK